MVEGRRNFKRSLLISLGVIMVGIIVAGLGLYYFSNDLSSQSTKIVTDKALIKQQTSIVSTLANLKNDAAAAVPYLAAMNQLLPTHDELIGFPRWVNDIAQKHDVAASFSFTGRNIAVSASAPASDSFSLNLTGSAANIQAFLDDLEVKAGGFLLTIDSFDLSLVGSSYSISTQGKVFSRG